MTLPPPPPIDWEEPYGRDWVAVQAHLIYAPTFVRAGFEVVRMPLHDAGRKRKTGFWAEPPNVPPWNAKESLNAIYRLLSDCESDYWTCYQRKE